MKQAQQTSVDSEPQPTKTTISDTQELNDDVIDIDELADPVENNDVEAVDIKATLDQIQLLEQKCNDINDKYLRGQAEMHNMQKRNSDELKKTRDFAISSFAKELIIVKDYLEMALKDESNDFNTLKTGVDLTLKQLSQVFDNYKIKAIIPQEKDKLDPHLHQPMNTVEVAGQEPNTIVSVMQNGYMLHERILRPAMVTVTK